MIRRPILFACALCLVAASAHAADPILLHVNTFPTARSLPFYVGVDKGIFARHGLKIELEFTDSSERQRNGLASGRSISCIRRSTTPSPWSRWPRSTS